MKDNKEEKRNLCELLDEAVTILKHCQVPKCDVYVDGYDCHLIKRQQLPDTGLIKFVKIMNEYIRENANQIC